jgi:hypothetical protein
MINQIEKLKTDIRQLNIECDYLILAEKVSFGKTKELIMLNDVINQELKRRGY